MKQERFEYLLSKELSDSLTAKESFELKELLSKFPKFATQYSIIRQYWFDKKSHSASDRVLFEQILQRIDYQEPLKHTPNLKKIMWLTAAAIVLFVIAFGIWTYLQRTIDNKLISAYTQRTVTLEDGTVVILNYKSVLYYPDTFANNQRQVSVEGEAFFCVAKDPQRPFIINTKHARLKVLGTRFNLRAYPNEETTEASLIEGALEVTVPNKGSKPILLRPTEKIIINNNARLRDDQTANQNVRKGKISFYSPADTLAIETVWMHNKLAFKDTRFAELAKALERKYDVKMVFGDQQVANVRFTVSFDQESLPEILEALQLASPFSYRTDRNTVILSSPTTK